MHFKNYSWTSSRKKKRSLQLPNNYGSNQTHAIQIQIHVNFFLTLKGELQWIVILSLLQCFLAGEECNFSLRINKNNHFQHFYAQ